MKARLEVLLWVALAAASALGLEDPAAIKDEAYWFKKYGGNYGVEYGRVVKAGVNGVEQISGEILNVVDAERVLVRNGSTVKALLVPTSDRVVDGETVSCLGREAGTYEYVTVLGAAKRVRQYRHIRKLTVVEFRKLGERYFPEIAAEKEKDDAEATARRKQEARERAEAERRAYRRRWYGAGR